MALQLLTSSLLGVAHGFTTREGGVSAGPFASLNCGLSVGDDAACVEENLARVARAANARTLATVSQVHGDVVVEAKLSEQLVPAPVAEADAVWSSTPGVAVGVKTADCVPILLWDRRRNAVAAVHAGWRGTIAEIVARQVEALTGAGSQPRDLVAAIGPCIRRCCYEVSPQLAQQFTAAFGARVIDGRKLDLVACVAATLNRVGVSTDRIDAGEACTACDAGRFFSHRRDGSRTGRHLSFVTCG